MRAPRSTPPVPRVTVLCGVLLATGLTLASGAILHAQETGGVITRLGIEQGLIYRTNPGLRDPSARAEARARTGLSFGIASETRTERLAFDADGALELGNNQRGRRLEDFSATASYRRISARARLEAELFLRERNVDTLELGFGADPITGALLPLVTTGGGRLRQAGGRLRGEFGRDGPFGGTITLSHTDARYRDTTDPSLVNNRRDTLAVTTRLAVTETATLTFGATRSVLREENSARQTTDRLSIGTVIDRPDGAWRATLDTTRVDTASRNRIGLSVGRQLDLPRGALDLQIGAVRSVAGNIRATGSVSWRHDLPTGQISTDLSRTISGDNRDNESEQTRLSLQARQDFTPDINGRLGLGLQQNRTTQTGTTSRGADLSVGLAVRLDQDWALNSRIEHRLRQETGSARRQGTTLSLSLRRDFVSQR